MLLLFFSYLDEEKVQLSANIYTFSYYNYIFHITDYNYN